MIKRKKIIILSCVAFLLAVYIGSWFFLYRLRLVGPMGRPIYFHYGEYKKWSDKALYVLYYPPYWAETHLVGHARYGMHWSDISSLYETLGLKHCTEIKIRSSEFPTTHPPYQKAFLFKLPDALMKNLIEEMKTADQSTAVECMTDCELVFILSDKSEKVLELGEDCKFVRSHEHYFTEDYFMHEDVSDAIKLFLQQNHVEL